jgi:uncharacterized repeat protein (TIGR03803 family)
MKLVKFLLFSLLIVIGLPLKAQSQFNYTIVNGSVNITGYTGSGGSEIIPDTINGFPVVTIGDSAFQFKTSLTSVTISTNVIKIGNNAFYGCSSLTNVSMPQGLTSIGNNAFQSCSSLPQVLIPGSVTNIGTQAFGGCSVMTNVIVGDGIVSLSDNMFYGSRLLSDIYIPVSVTRIGAYAFGYCGGFKSFDVPANVKSIGDKAFFQCSGLTNVSIPANVTNIGVAPFLACTNLAAIAVDTNNLCYATDVGVLFSWDRTRLIQFPGAKGGEYVVPDTVTNVGDYSFYNCYQITNAILGTNTTTIGNSAFYSCVSLTNIFLGSNVLSIGSFAFYGCSGLKTVDIPACATNIGTGPFAGCTNLVAINVDLNNPVYKSDGGILYNRDQTLLIQVPAGMKGSLNISQGVSKIGDYALQYCQAITNITIPSTVNNIGNYAFYACKGLNSIEIPNAVTNIGIYCLAYCQNLTTVSFGTGLRTIGDYAFASSANLYFLYFYGNAPTLGGSYVFSGVSYAKLYYAPDKSGWTTILGGILTYPWIPPGGPGYSSLGAQIQTVYNFQSADYGAAPNASVTMGADGNYYGTTYAGGSNYCGTVFKMTPDGRLTTLVSFNSSNGANPYAALTLGNNGCFYGTTMNGGLINSQNASGMGTVFKITTNGELTTLVYFNETNGTQPWAGLVLGNDGWFYGTTAYGGMTNASLQRGHGTVFRVNTNGELATLAMFKSTNGYLPTAGLTMGSDGNFYGTTWGGTNGSGTGTLFKMPTNGALNMLFVFGGTNGSSPNALTMGNDGNLYGTTSAMLFRLDTNAMVTILTKFGSTNKITTLTPASDTGFYGTGTKGIFRVGIDGSITNIFSFNSTNGNLKAPVVLKADGGIVGTTPDGGAYGVGTVYQLNSDGLFSTIFSFANTPGAKPKGLSLGPDGEIYGTTIDGGSFGGGSFYKIGIDGGLKSLYSFDPSYTDGGTSPMSMGALAPTITLGGDGNFYGTTYYGGSGSVGSYYSLGTMFRLSPSGAYKSLYSFNGTDGGGPYAAMTLGSDGTFYGTTLYRVVSSMSYYWTDAGKVFQLKTNGSFTALYTLPSTMNYKTASLTEGADGYLYGTSQRGGTPNYGVIYKVSTNGTFATLSYFAGTNGASPQSPLRLANDGNSYGVAYGGYTNNTYPEGMGTIYKVTTSGKITSLFRFAFTSTNGIHPVDLTMGTDGNFYGVTLSGGVSTSQFTSGMGTIFRITTNGAFSTLATFDTTTGAGPNCALLQGPDGNFYGTTYSGGITNSAFPYGMGTVFRLILPLAITSQPKSQTNYAGATILFKVDVFSLNPLSYQWQKNGTNLANAGSISGAFTNTLTIMNITSADEANYSVIVSNSNCTAVSYSAKLTVITPPSLSAQFVSGNLQLNFTGMITKNFVVQYCTNLANPDWANLISVTNLSESPYIFQDPESHVSPSRFYRVLMQ